jgi:hypothetical protein
MLAVLHQFWWAWYIGSPVVLKTIMGLTNSPLAVRLCRPLPSLRAWLELADAGDLKSSGAKASCRFDPCRSHQFGG